MKIGKSNVVGADGVGVDGGNVTLGCYTAFTHIGTIRFKIGDTLHNVIEIQREGPVLIRGVEVDNDPGIHNAFHYWFETAQQVAPNNATPSTFMAHHNIRVVSGPGGIGDGPGKAGKPGEIIFGIDDVPVLTIKFPNLIVDGTGKELDDDEAYAALRRWMSAAKVMNR